MKIEKTECSYQVTECDLKFGEQITLGGELLTSVSVLDKIRAEIKTMSGDIETIADVLAIIDKYKGESAEEDNKRIMPWYLEPFKRAIETYKGESEG